jgi:ribosomal protein S18 acetylase RimI-like enzyme
MIDYQTTLENITPQQLTSFFAGWPKRPSPEKHHDILNGSAHIVLAVDRDSARVVGFVNAISDGVFSAFIPLLEVLPEYQGRGIGRELFSRMLEQLRGYYAIDLICDDQLQAFYEKLGLTKLTGMALRHYEWPGFRVEP